MIKRNPLLIVLLVLSMIGIYSCKSDKSDVKPKVIEKDTNDQKDNNQAEDNDDNPDDNNTDDNNTDNNTGDDSNDQNTNDDVWDKIKIEFRMGHTHGKSFHANPTSDKIKYLKRFQSIEISHDAQGKIVVPNTPIRFVQGNYYAMEIVYYNKKGERMNADFTSEEAAKTNQHFFFNENVKKINTDDAFASPNTTLKYVYRDTNPEEKQYKKGGVLRKDPIGLKGYFYINKSHVEFDLNIVLAHIVEGTKAKEDGTYYKFDDPKDSFLNEKYVDIRIPIRVYAARAGYSPGDEVKFYKDAAAEFGVTVEDIQKEEEFIWDLPFESSDYHM